ncbi:ankyrin repeat-containing domain-containing [Fusarium acutatum]|uniref:Ankyrin repeat-containing domain-containing n=1 Tax=Fusarium acutatum TaxID=78861 RepID=A0A8H4JAM8_9HYPO|nr:ankyrin repeat-containing domain-containing [Fusarium acutatum]
MMSLWLLSFTATGDFNRHELHGALPLATRNGWTEVVSAILEMGGDINSKDKESRTPVSYYVEYGNSSLLQHFIDLGASLHTEDNQRRTPIIWAVEYKQTDVAEALLRAGYVNHRQQDSDYNTPLSWVIANGLVGIMQLLPDLEAGMEPDLRIPDHDLISMASETGHKAILEALLERNISIEAVETVLRRALRARMDEVVESLLPYIDDLTAHHDIWTSMLSAVLEGHWTCVVLYLETCVAT